MTITMRVPKSRTAKMREVGETREGAGTEGKGDTIRTMTVDRQSAEGRQGRRRSTSRGPSRREIRVSSLLLLKLETMQNGNWSKGVHRIYVRKLHDIPQYRYQTTGYSLCASPLTFVVLSGTSFFGC